jgi:hypothetical protein
MRKLQILSDYSEAVQRLASLINSSNIFEIIEAFDKAIIVVEEMAEIMRDDGVRDGAYEQMQNELKNLTKMRAQLISNL